MAVEILYSWGPGESRLAAVKDGRLVDLSVVRAETVAGSVFLGRVSEMAPKLGAVFIDIGQDKPGFLQGVKGLTKGQAILVQAKADAHAEKGATLTVEIQLPGRYLTLTPSRPGLSVPRKLGDDRARRLVERLETMITDDDGLAVRAQAANVSDQMLAQDLDGLRQDWQAIQEGQKAGKAPAMLWRTDPLTRLLAEHTAVTSIVTDDDETVARLRARYGELVRRHHGAESIFEPVEDAVAATLSPVVQLACGGRVAIETTAALTAIDVDSGPADPAEANTQAVPVIARQLRLRNIAGQIVIDFVPGGGRGVLARLISQLKQATSGDPVATHVLGTSALGLVEMTRERRGPSLASLMTETASGSSPLAAAFAALRLAVAQAHHHPGPALQLTVAPDVALCLASRPQAVAEAESRLGRSLSIRPDPTRTRDDATLEAVR